MEVDTSVKPQIVRLKTQLVSQGHTRKLLAETDLTTLRIHCYAPGIGENALHAHMNEDHIFLVLDGTALFLGPEGEMARLDKHQAIVLPKRCFYQFSNCGQEPLVMARFGANKEKDDWRISPDGTRIPGRSHEQGYAAPVLIDNAFFE
jgi:oxalate decarboxylase/phosphoglucose isomerase-like protein (cupin superfamily)